MDSVNQKIQQAKEEEGKEDIEDLDLVRNNPDHPVDLIIMTVSQETWIIVGQINCSSDFTRRSDR